MKRVTASSKWFLRQPGIGWDGATMLTLSNMVLLATAGLSGLWLLYRVWRTAFTAPIAGVEGDWVVVLGSRLAQDHVTMGYARRLHRAAALHRQDPRRRILLVGGFTGGRVSEAECGRQYLCALGVPASSLFVEDESLNTLDNLRRARQLQPELSERPFILVTSRFHLARSKALACGLNLQPVLCAAEDRLPHDFLSFWRLGQEAYYLHWYAVGKRWSQWTRNRHSLARIT